MNILSCNKIQIWKIDVNKFDHPPKLIDSYSLKELRTNQSSKPTSFLFYSVCMRVTRRFIKSLPNEMIYVYRSCELTFEKGKKFFASKYH